MAMTPRQRWLALFHKQKTDRIPTAYQATQEVTRRLMKDLGCKTDEDLWARLHIDAPRHVGPRCLQPHNPAGATDTDIWGIRYRDIDYGTGSYHEAATHPLAHMTSVEEVNAYPWPSPDQFDFSVVSEQVKADDGYRVMYGGSYEPFLLYAYLRGLEQAFEDLVLNPAIVDAALGQLFKFYYEFNRRLFEAGRGKIDIFYLAEDLGGQTGPLMSLDHYRRHLLPGQKVMADLVRSYGIHVAYHTDGAARIFMDDLVHTVRIETLNPVQWRCPGMEREGLVRDFADHLVFHGGMDNQYTMPFGKVDEVVQEVKDNLRIFKDARWICGPCHNFQPVTPTENIVVMYETIHKLGGR